MITHEREHGSAVPQLIIVASAEELAKYTEPRGALKTIAGWIEAHNKHQQQEHGGQGTMLPQTPDQLGAILGKTLGVVVVAWDAAADQHVPVAFCALHTAPEGEPLPDGVLELGTLIRYPQSTIKGLGLFATKAALGLPAAQAANTVYAYANMNSLPVFTVQSLKFAGVGATVLSEAALEADFPYLGAYAGDTIVDLTPLKQKFGGVA